MRCVNNVNFHENFVTFPKTTFASLMQNETENSFEDFIGNSCFCAINAAFNKSGC